VAFPTVESTTGTQFSTSTTSHDVAMPATVNANDLLVMVCGWYSTAAQTTPDGWTLLGTNTKADIYVKKADGTEGGTTVDVVLNTARTGAVNVLRISGWYGDLAGVEIGTWSDSGGTSAPDPPSVTATWGSADNLWIAFTCGTDDDATANAAPANYTNLVSTVSGAGTNAGAEVCTATRQNATDAEDPGAFELSESEGTQTNTIVVRPAAGGGDIVVLRRRRM